MFIDLGLRNLTLATRVVIFPQALAAIYFADTGRNAAKDGAISDTDLFGLARRHRRSSQPAPVVW